MDVELALRVASVVLGRVDAAVAGNHCPRRWLHLGTMFLKDMMFTSWQMVFWSECPSWILRAFRSSAFFVRLFCVLGLGCMACFWSWEHQESVDKC